MVNKEKVHELVSIFYRSNFKTFYINSEDGKEFSKPGAVFVSLGITTSMSQIDNVKNILTGCGDYSVKVVEIGSKKIGDTYLNFVSRENPEQYFLDDPPKDLLDREGTQEKIRELEQKIVNSDAPTMSVLGKLIQRLRYLSDQLDRSGGWETHRIKAEEEDYKIYHLLVNYRKDSGVEYRVGLLVDEKN